MKTKSKVSRKYRNRHPHREAPSATPQQRFRTMRIEPMERVMISKYMDGFLMVIQNFGPGKISVDDSTLDHVELKPGKLLVTSGDGQIDVESKDEHAALIELEFMPTLK